MEWIGRMRMRVAGMLFARLSELPLAEILDPRGERGRRWSLSSLLTALVVAMTAGAKNLREVEALTAEMSPIMRRKLGIGRRLPDTTAHDVLCRLEPRSLRTLIYAVVKAALRRKALPPEGLPFHVASLDGKSVSSSEANDSYAQGQPATPARSSFGLVRTVTATLSSSRARPCLDAVPIPAFANEMSHFRIALRALVAAYGNLLFRVITYDAGACSKDNARAVLSEGLDYLFALKGGAQAQLFETASFVMESCLGEPLAQTRDVIGAGKVTCRRLWLWSPTKESLPGLKTILRVQSETVDDKGQRLSGEERFFVSSLDTTELSAAQWLLLVRMHWRVENDCHKTWDVAFEEDDKRWIPSNPRAMVVVKLLRRIAYNMLALFRSVTQRSEEKRGTPWKDLIRWVYQSLITATEEQLHGLRPRLPVTVCG